MFQAKNLRATQFENKGTVQADRSRHSAFWLWSGLQQTECEVKNGTNVDRSQQEIDTADKSPS